MAAAALALLCAGVRAGVAVEAAPMCQTASFEGEVKAGESYTRPLGNGMVFKLEAVRAGWIIRVLPAAGARPPQDAAELATPPYNSLTPLAVTTDYSFRAQDAVAWNPRRFQFAGSAPEMARLAAAFKVYQARPQDAAAEERLAELAAAAPAGELRILDARLIPGAANQGQMAASVASHFSQTPHTLEQAPGATPLGAVTWMRFRVTLRLPRNYPAAGLGADKSGCR